MRYAWSARSRNRDGTRDTHVEPSDDRSEDQQTDEHTGDNSNDASGRHPATDISFALGLRRRTAHFVVDADVSLAVLTAALGDADGEATIALEGVAVTRRTDCVVVKVDEGTGATDGVKEVFAMLGVCAGISMYS